MQMEWVFPVDGAIEAAAAAMEQQLRSLEGMIAADVDAHSRRVELMFDADQVCGGEILAVVRACGCSPSNP